MTSKGLLNQDKFIVSRTELVVYVNDKNRIDWSALRESKHREVIRVKARKNEAKLARDKWIELKFENMKKN